jgi:hypothetical protein
LRPLPPRATAPDLVLFLPPSSWQSEAGADGWLLYDDECGLFDLEPTASGLAPELTVIRR